MSDLKPAYINSDGLYVPGQQGYTYQDLQNAGVTTPLFDNPLQTIENNVTDFENKITDGFTNLSSGLKIALILGIAVVGYSVFVSVKKRRR